MKSLRSLVLALALAGSLALAVVPPATAAEVARPLRGWLLALEAVPTAAQLRKAGGADLESALDRVVRDAQEPAYARHRALSFLGILDGEPARQRLRGHLRHADPTLRATAALSWAAGPGRRSPQTALPELDRLLADPVPSVRAATARSLEFVGDAKAARDRAVRRRQIEPAAEVRQALDRAVGRIDARSRGQR